MGCGTCEKSLAVGIPVYDDFRTAAMTIQAVRMQLNRADILVADNNPSSEQGKQLADFCRKAGVRYIEAGEINGTAYPRQRIFEEADREIVCCIDSHILTVPGGLQSAAQQLATNPSGDLFHGVLVMDNGKSIATHMEPEWGPDLMFGRWCREPDARGTIPGPPFEIPMHGMGLFLCRKDAWLGFPPGLRGFGGSEGMVHEAFRSAGRKVWCIPSLRWWHLFHDPKQPTAYPNSIEDRCRNHLIWRLTLGLPLDEMKAHYDASDLAPKGLFDRCLMEAQAITAPHRNLPAFSTRVWNFTKHVAARIQSGGVRVGATQYKERTEICRTCEHRAGTDCTKCGCPIAEKAKWAVEQCPLESPKWVAGKSPEPEKPKVSPSTCRHKNHAKARVLCYDCRELIELPAK